MPEAWRASFPASRLPRGKGALVRRQIVWAALLRKEWCEQRWRFFLGTIVLSGLLAGLLRAQIISSLEAEVLIYGLVGLVMVIFFAAGPVATERADRTWEFLTVQPVTRSDVILAKWAIGVFQLAATMILATIAGLLATWSRGFRIMPDLSESFASVEAFGTWSTVHPALSLCAFAGVSTLALACWFTPLFLLLARARNEFAAALGGLLLTIALLLWSQLGWMAMLNPLAPLVLMFLPHPPVSIPLFLPVDIALWIVVPLWCTRHKFARLMEKWMGI